MAAQGARTATLARPHTATPWHEARELAHRVAEPLPAEEVALFVAAGYTLAAPVVAATALPAFDNAAMDGYAVQGTGPWRLTGRVMAGDSAAVALSSGEAVEIATGAPVPIGTDRVVRYETSHRVDDLVFEAINGHMAGDGRTHIRRAGEYVAAGAEVLAAGAVLRAAAIGLAASVGIDSVLVRRQPRVAIIVTGDEVVAAGVPAHGAVRDAISPTMAVLLPAWGAAVTTVQALPDSVDALTCAVTAAASTADVIVVCGSSSVGGEDHLHRVLRRVRAHTYIDRVACRPGHPQVLAQTGPQWIIGLPGNPYAALVAACTILQPLLAGLAGRALADLPRAVLAGDVSRDEHHTRLVPVRWQGNQVQAVGVSRPAYLGPAASADALAVVAPGPRPDSTVGPDSTVELLCLPV